VPQGKAINKMMIKRNKQGEATTHLLLLILIKQVDVLNLLHFPVNVSDTDIEVCDSSSSLLCHRNLLTNVTGRFHSVNVLLTPLYLNNGIDM